MAGSTITLTANQAYPSSMDIREIDAARALLGVSPQSRSASGTQSVGVSSPIHSTQPMKANTVSHGFFAEPLSVPLPSKSHGFVWEKAGSEAREYPAEEVPTRRPRSDSGGLETLAALAEREQQRSTHRPLPAFLMPGGSTSTVSSSSSSANSSEEAESMLPPPPRKPVRRQRSVSNPEGMEKWDTLFSNHCRSSRRHFVLPASILEEELAEANEAVRQQCGSPIQESCIPEDAEYHGELVLQKSSQITCKDEQEEVVLASQNDTGEEVNLSPDELLRRARSRLIEDLSEAMNGEKGTFSLPHTLDKYKELYNRNGRIGIYTPSERAAIISRFNEKRTKRNWNKKIRYNCRKSLADRRLRVKGRFVKRSEQEELAKKLKEEDEPQNDGIAHTTKRVTITDKVEVHESNLIASADTQEDCHSNESKKCPSGDEDMPDVNDPDAGFAPTDDLPYRRLRRHTIT